MNQGGYQTLKMPLPTYTEVTGTCLHMSSMKQILRCVRTYHEYIHTNIYIYTHCNKRQGKATLPQAYH